MSQKKLENITKEKLYQLYLIEKISMNKLAKLYNVDRKVIRRILTKFGFPIINEGLAYKQSIKEKLIELTYDLLQELYINQRKTIAYLSNRYKLRKKIIRRRLVEFGFQIRDGHTGENNHTHGKEMSSKTKKNISEANEKCKLTYEELYQLYWVEEKSLSIIGRMFNFGKDTIKKRALKVGLVLRDRKTAMKLAIGGNKHYRWNGGTNLKTLIKLSPEYNNWRRSCFSRDNRTCQLCGLCDNKVEFHIDHIVPFSYLIRKHNITSLKEAVDCKELWDVSNGRCLCKQCHEDTDTYGSKALNYIPPQHDIVADTNDNCQSI